MRSRTREYTARARRLSMALRSTTIVAVVALGVAACAAGPRATDRPAEDTSVRQASRVGIGIDMGGTRLFVDAAKTLRAWEYHDGSRIPIELLDEHGWPMVDPRTVVFDERPIPAWAPPIDDPDEYMADVSGTYAMRFTGQAEVRNGQDAAGPQAEIRNISYDATTNTTTGEIVLPPGRGLLILEFSRTRRTPESAEGSGITDLRVIRPGYDPDTEQTIATPVLTALTRSAFHSIRFMDYSHTNNRDHGYPNVTEWSDRKLPSDTTQNAWGTKRGGGAWEYAIEIANLTKTNPWFTLPVDATDGYVRGLAELVRDSLDPSLVVYVEHSNEVWNALFSQKLWNASAAVAEVRDDPDSDLDFGSPFDTSVWEVRRHMRRTVEIGTIFTDVLGEHRIGDRVRPVFSWWVTRGFEYIDALEWLEATRGPASDSVWGIGITAYFSSAAAGPSADVEEIMSVMVRDMETGGRRTEQYRDIADRFGLRLAVYEGGTDTGQNARGPVANRITAERDPRMGTLLYRSVTEQFLQKGGDLYMVFALAGRYSRYGSWGITDDIAVPDRNAKYSAVERAAIESATGLRR